MWVEARVHRWQLKHNHPIASKERIAGLARDFSAEDLEPFCAVVAVKRLVLVQASASTAFDS